MDNKGIGQKGLYNYSTLLRKEFPFVTDLNSSACQASVEPTWSAISRFYDNCKRASVKKKGYPKFKKNQRSVEYKTSGWKLSEDRKSVEIILILEKKMIIYIRIIKNSFSCFTF
jgi:putative transposase